MRAGSHHRPDRPERRRQDDAVRRHLRLRARRPPGASLFEGADITDEPPHRAGALGIARTFQIVQPFAGLTRAREHRRRRLSAPRAAQRRAWPAPKRSRAASASAPSSTSRPPSLTVAGRKRLELARALATEPKLLLLDEVLAGLNPSEIRDIVPVIRAIRDDGVTILMIEHVMQAVMNLCEHVHVLAQGRIIAEGTPAGGVRRPAGDRGLSRPGRRRSGCRARRRAHA